MKTCSKCGGSGPFGVNRTAKDGLSSQCKECRRKYYEEHKEEALEYCRKYRKEHKEYRAERDRKYRQGHKVEIAERNRKYRREHKKKIAERSREYWKKHGKEINERNREYRKKHREEVNEHDRAYYLSSKKDKAEQIRRVRTNMGKISVLISAEKSREKYPERIKASSKLRNAIKSGRLVAPSVCSIKDGHCSGLIHGHHEDYSKPLDVVWLCHHHHMKLHRIKREKNRVAGPLLESYYFEQWPTHLDL